MIYVVGEQVGRSEKRETSRRLARLFGTSHDEMLRSIVWVNLFEIEGTDPRLYAESIERAALPNDVIVLLGRRVARGWALDHLRPLDSIRRGAGAGPTILVVPHPSGRNRWYNDPDHTEDAHLVLSRIWMRHR